jgi:uncharacterized protein
VLADLRGLGPTVHGVHGNMDDPGIRETLPREAVVEVDGVRIGIVHDAGAAAGRAERLRDRFPGCAAIVYGHTHLPQVERVAGVWILNPGSPTERRRAPRHSFLLLRVSRDEVVPELVQIGP